MTIDKAGTTSIHKASEMESQWDRNSMRVKESRILTILQEFHQKWMESASSVENINTSLCNNVSVHGQKCKSCGKLGHFARISLSAKRQ